MPIENAELMVPPVAQGDPNSFEIMRVWAAEEAQHVTIRSNLNGGAGEFGYMLAQLAHHGARLYAQRDSMAEAEAMREILKRFKKEIRHNTGDPSGSIPD